MLRTELVELAKRNGIAHSRLNKSELEAALVAKGVSISNEVVATPVVEETTEVSAAWSQLIPISKRNNFAGADAALTIALKEAKEFLGVPTEGDFIMKPKQHNPVENKGGTNMAVLQYVETPTKMVEVMGWVYSVAMLNDKLVYMRNEALVMISANNALYPYVVSGDLKPMKFDIADNELRQAAIFDALDKAFASSKARTGEPKFIIGHKAENYETPMYVGYRSTFTKIIGMDMSLKVPATKAIMPCFSNSVLKLRSSTIKAMKLRVVDTTRDGKKIHADGMTYLNGEIELQYEEYMSQAKLDKGKTPEIKSLDMGQYRVEGEGFDVVKSLMSFTKGVNEAKDFCEFHGLELGDCHGAIEFGNLKTNPLNLKHGDVYEVPIEKIRFINILAGNRSSAGKQLVCTHAPSATALIGEARPEHGEVGIAAKCAVFKQALAFKASAIKEVIASTSGMDDTPVQEIKALHFAIPRANGEYYAPAFQGIFAQLSARLWSHYTGQVLKTKTSNTGHYAKAHPTMLLDKLMAQIEEVYGEQVNLLIASGRPALAEQIENFTYSAIGRSPITGLASVQGALYLREEEDGSGYILDPKRLRAKEGKLVTIGWDGIYVPQAMCEALFLDFDGDTLIEIFSNVANFPVFRVELEALEGGKKSEPVVLSDEDFKEALKSAYGAMIQSATDIGMLDNFTRILYTVRRVLTGRHCTFGGQLRICKPIGPEIAMKIAVKREAAIQNKKHVGGKTAKKEGAAAEVIKELTYKYAPNGEMPKGRMIPPSARLLSRTMALQAEEGVDTYSAKAKLEELCFTVMEYQPHDSDCYRDGWMALKGSKIQIRHEDSQYYKEKFDALWANKNEILGKKISALTSAKIEAFATLVTDGGKGFDVYPAFAGYRASAGSYGRIRNEQVKDKQFKLLGELVISKINGFLDNLAGEDMEKRAVLEKVLAMAFAKISFGIKTNAETQQVTSLPGYCLWYMDKAVLTWCARTIHPDNPFLPKVNL